MASTSSGPIPLSAIRGFGPKHLEMLGKLGITTHEELLHHVPARYEDRRHLKPVSAAREGEPVTVRGIIHSTKSSRWRGGRSVFEIMVGPASVTQKSDLVRGMWFNQSGRKHTHTEGRELFMYGKLGKSKSGTWVMMFPEIEMIEEGADSYVHMDRITPIYPLTEGVSQLALRRMMFDAKDTDLRAGILSRAEGDDVARGGVPRHPFPRFVHGGGKRAAAAGLRRVFCSAVRRGAAKDVAGDGASRAGEEFGARAERALARGVALSADARAAARDGRD
jgi:hypothetical protein